MTFRLFLLIPELLILAVVFWNVVSWPRVTAVAHHDGEMAILIPARNEESNLGACLESVLAQGTVVKEILMYDDHSTDTTPSLIEQYVRRDKRIRVVPAVPLPSGWVGKNFACAQLAGAAQSEWMLFLDADTHLFEEASLRMLAEAGARAVTLLSCWPALEMGSFWERILLPMLNFMVFTIFPGPLSLRRWDPALGLAHGACVLVRRDKYEAIGGHASVRNAITEDIRLAQLWREHGERGVCLDGTGTVSVRMYRSFAEIWQGFQKNFFPGFRSEVTFWGFILLHSIFFLSPFCIFPALISVGGSWVFALSLVIFCVMLMRLLLAVRFRQKIWPIFLHPVAEAILILLALSSWWRCRSGKGVNWKGRRYHTATRG